ncbi:MAG: SH3 domain-containing protein [Proteobacteria bacterium]|nr:SH3 domain-containing protein [Pseudomonadota bacterium]
MLTKIKTILYTIIILVLVVSTTSFAEMKSTSGEKVSLRTGPGEKYNVKWEFGNGFPVKILSKKGKWTKVQDFENDSGWVYTSMLNNKPHIIVKVNKGKNIKINIRSGPGPKYSVVGKAYYGVVFEKKEQKKGWVKVRHESGLEGWIEKSLVWGF